MSKNIISHDALRAAFAIAKNRNIKKFHSRVFLSAFFLHIMRMRKSLASVEKIFYIERYGEIRIVATKIFSQTGWTIGRWFTILEDKVIVNILSFKWTFNYRLVAAKTNKNNPEEGVAMTFCCALLLKRPMKPIDVYSVLNICNDICIYGNLPGINMSVICIIEQM